MCVLVLGEFAADFCSKELLTTVVAAIGPDSNLILNWVKGS